MDTASLIIGLVLTLICAVPLIYIANNQAKNKKKVTEIFNHFRQGKYDFSTKETHYKKIYSLDKTNKGFLFIDLNKENDRASFVDLSEVNSCRIEETSSGNNDDKIIFTFKLKNGNTTTIVLYDLETDKLGKAYWQENEQIAKKWQLIVENTI
ncbi:MAG: hypothetical protein BGO88_06455 [Flavobacterium sp. 38-13]|uniref:hypothetical protein n=1 Tax=Flavobacterium sp. 38-13 TaxID=1896168 RepID=UPI00095C8C45|nr:hypothetical protein [Flavobacterium sp. 38-13]OJX53622.1 MAG: hypothetical protein BGO88_06455 [Flavobacterium sp. 38-13]